MSDECHEATAPDPLAVRNARNDNDGSRPHTRSDGPMGPLRGDQHLTVLCADMLRTSAGMRIPHQAAQTYKEAITRGSVLPPRPFRSRLYSGLNAHFDVFEINELSGEAARKSRTLRQAGVTRGPRFPAAVVCNRTGVEPLGQSTLAWWHGMNART